MREEKKSNLKLKLTIAIILLLIAFAMLGIGIWASQAGKDLFKGYIDIKTEDINGIISAKVSGTNNEGEGFDKEKTLWDSDYNVEETVDWENVNFSFENKDQPIEIFIYVTNRNTDDEILADFNVKLGDYFLSETEQVIGDTNIIGFIEYAPATVGKALSNEEYTKEFFKVVLKIDNTGKSVEPTDIEITLSLTGAV